MLIGIKLKAILRMEYEMGSLDAEPCYKIDKKKRQREFKNIETFF